MRSKAIAQYFRCFAHSLKQKASSHSKDLEDPLDLSVGAVVSAVEMQEKLVAADRVQELSTIVVESARPCAFVKIEQ